MSNPSKNSFMMIAVFVITAAINYIYNVSMGWLLPPEQFGILGVSISLALILALFVTSAFPLTSAKFISEEHGTETKHRVFKTSLIANVIIGFFLSVVFYFACFVKVLDLGPNYKLLVPGIMAATITSSAMVIYLSLLQGTFRFRSLAIAGTATVVAKLFSAVFLVKLGYGAFGALMALPIANLVTLVIAVYLAHDFRFWDTKGWADSHIYFFALPMFFGTLGMTLLMNIDIIAIKILADGLMSDTLAGYYRASLILAQLPVFLVGAMMSVLFPYIAKHSDNDAYSLKSIKYAAIFILPVSVTIASIPGSLISIVFPDAYLSAASALRVISIGMGFLVMIIVVTQVFQAKHAPRIPAIILPFSVVIEIFMLFFLIPQYGIVGAAMSTTIGCGLALMLLTISYARNYRLKMDFSLAFKMGVSFVLYSSMLILIPHSGFLSVILDIGLSGIMYLFFLAAFNLFGEEDFEIILSGFPCHSFICKVSDPFRQVIRRLNALGI